jgi:hypothetical protein
VTAESIPPASALAAGLVDCHEVHPRVVFNHTICYPQTMRITVQLPDDLIQHPNPGREALEALSIEGYRVGIVFEMNEIKKLFDQS